MKLKLHRGAINLLHLCVGSLGVLLIVALRPILSIRLASTNSSRVGHFSVNTELALLELGSRNTRTRKEVILWIQWREVSNSFLALKWKEKIRTIPLPFLVSTWFVIDKFKLNGFSYSSSSDDRDVLDLLPTFQSILSFTDPEILRGQTLLAKMGIPFDAKWVCIHNRDSKYLRTEFPSKDFSYHDFRDTDIKDYSAAMLALVDLGYFVIRMGKVVEEKINISHPMIIDYPLSEFRDDFHDVFLAARCSFFISSGSGIDGIANIFRRPQLYVNLPLPFHPLTNKRDHVFIYQHFTDVDSKQKLSLAELMNRRAFDIFTSKGFADAGIGLRRNDPLEIVHAVLDMHNLVINGSTLNGAELVDQRAFWEAFPRINHLHGNAPFRATIGPSFLRANSHLPQ